MLRKKLIAARWDLRLFVQSAMLLMASVCPLSAQDVIFDGGNRQRFGAPILMIDSDAPYAETLVMTSNDDWLFAAGRDRVVRSWPIRDGRPVNQKPRIFRWPASGSTRGLINVMAISPDSKRLAIGGYGLTDSSIAEFDIETGKMLWATGEAGGGLNLDGVVTAMSYGPDRRIWFGTEFGSVATALQIDGDEQPQMHRVFSADDGTANSPRILAIGRHDQQMIAVLSNGQVATINADGKTIRTDRVATDSDSILTTAAVSPSGDLIATIEKRRSSFVLKVMHRNDWDALFSKAFSTHGSSRVELPRKVCFSRGSQTIFFATIVSEETTGKLRHESGKCYSIQLNKNQVVREYQSMSSPVTSISSISDSGLAVSIRDNHELSVFEQPGMGRPNQIFRILNSDQNAIRSIEFSKDLRAIRFQRQHRKLGSTIERQGSGDFETFSLDRREFDNINTQFLGATGRTTEWAVFYDSHANGSGIGVKGPKERTHKIELDYYLDNRGCSATFLGNLGTSANPNLAIGHKDGVSVFKLTADGKPQRVRRLTGHLGNVTALGPSPDGKLLLSGGEDGTICCFSLEPWPSHPELGASFVKQAGRVFVKSVDVGSPAWESGIEVGEELVGLGYANNTIDKVDWLKALETPAPGVDIEFEVRSRNSDKVKQKSLKLNQKPLWKFYPKGDEWILWRWHDFFYDCSAMGHTLIGWQINDGFYRQPRYLRAEAVRDRFHRREMLDDILSLQSLTPQRIETALLTPPVVELVTEQAGKDLVATVKLVHDGDAFTEPVAELSLWLEDYRLQQWLRAKPGMEQRVIIPRKLLRPGENRLIARAWKNNGVRGDSQEAILVGPPTAQRNWHVLSVGISKYGGGTSNDRGRVLFGDLDFPDDDAKAFSEFMKLQKSDADPKRSVSVETLLDQDANRSKFKSKLNEISGRVAPNDFLILFLAGHGWAAPIGKGNFDAKSFTFVTPDFRLASNGQLPVNGIPIARTRFLEDEVSDFSLFDALAKINCQKMVLLDSCHSGGAEDMIQCLTPDFKVGPMIICAADRNQFAYESNVDRHGVFSTTILKALSERFGEADLDHDRLLSFRELEAFCQIGMPDYLANAKDLYRDNGQSAQTQIAQESVSWAPDGVKDRPLFLKSADWMKKYYSEYP